MLGGVWHDDYGAFPKYSYVRNYIGSSHQPEMKEEGCTILVKLRQQSELHVEPPHSSWDASPESTGWTQVDDALVDKEESVCLRKELYHSVHESVCVERWQGTVNVQVPEGGAEVFVVDNTCTSHLGTHHPHSWARFVVPALVRCVDFIF